MPVEIAPVVPQPTTVSHGDWKITLPTGWTYDDTPQLSGAIATRVLDATSNVKVGRGPLKVSVNTITFSKPMPDELFVLAVAENSEEMFDGKMVKAEDVEVDGHSSGFIVLVKQDVGVGIVVLASGRGKLGYVVTCSGDAVNPAGEVTAKTCIEVLKTFHAK